MDEFQYAHAAWLLGRGQVPYLDFFEVHFPFVYQWLAPWLLRAQASAEQSALWARAGMLPLLALGGAGAYLVGAARGEVGAPGRAAGALSAAALFAAPGFAAFATEVRPDAAGACLLLGSLGALALAAERGGYARQAFGFLGGLLLAGCLWSTQKAWVYAAPVAAAVALALVWPRLRAAVAAPAMTGLGLFAGLGAAAAWLWGTGSAAAFWHWCFEWAAEHQASYPGFGLGEYFVPALPAHAWLFGLAAAGAAAVVRARWAARERLPGVEVLLLWLLPAAFASFALQRAPFPYSFLPLFAVAAPLAARGALAVLELLRGPHARAAGGAALLGLGAAQWIALERLRWPGNAGQRETLRAVDALTGPDDAVYDNSGGFIARPHASFFFYTDAYLRGAMARALERDVPEALAQAQVVAVLRDLREEGLPPSVRGFLAANYQPWDGDLALWGRRFEVSGGALRARFYAVKAGRYFARVEQGALSVGGKAVGAEPFFLERGLHEVAYEGPAASLELLWLPRTGERWAPRPGLAPRFSRLF